MNPVSLIALVGIIYVAVFLTARIELGRDLVGAQLDFLPAFALYAGLEFGTGGLCLVAVWGGLLFDALSGNPPGASTVALLLVGWAARQNREFVLREKPYTQFLLGVGASLVAPLVSLGVQLGLGHRPLLGGSTLWQLVFLAVVGGCVTPSVFRLFQRIEHAFGYQRVAESSFRADREIKRGRD